MTRPRAMTNIRSFDATFAASGSICKTKHGRSTSELTILPIDNQKCQRSRPRNYGQTAAHESGIKLDFNLGHPVDLNIDQSIELVPMVPNAMGPESSRKLDSKTLRNTLASLPLHTQNINDTEKEPLSMITKEIDTRKDAKAPDITSSSVSLKELVDRLLSPLMSKSDAKFISIFLCLYRKFAAPSDLVSAIISRFEAVSESQEVYMLRVTSQLRYLGVLAQWVSGYPGDFAHPLTRQITTDFLSRLACTRIFATARKQMNFTLEVLVEDDDTEWACSDSERSGLSMVTTDLRKSFIPTPICPRKFEPITQDTYDMCEQGDLSKHRATRHSGSLSIASSLGRSDSQSSASYDTILDPVELAQCQAQRLAPTPKICLTKDQWHRLMEIPENDIARELTRIDWIMYTSIRPRDLIRHATLSADERSKYKRLENIDRMINHFNHVAFWVANLILLRDKPKHRARILERFMRIAWKLRCLNNYNSLGAILAGINGTAVHRLAQTKDLVPVLTQKQFMRLEILMSTQKGHFAYRLAWANTTCERIPFLPLHRRDLILAEEGNQTHLGGAIGRINWGKFDVMGDVIIGIQRSQCTSYPQFPPNEEIQRLVLEGAFSKDDDVLYDRSLQVENADVGENTRKLFNWF